MIRLPACAICGKSVPPASDPNSNYAPFCSRRCKEVDLIRWCDGRYAIVEAVGPDKMAEIEIEEVGMTDSFDEQGVEFDD